MLTFIMDRSTAKSEQFTGITKINKTEYKMELNLF
jgi:hypothetical protein